jgi:hypothetical protein
MGRTRLPARRHLTRGAGYGERSWAQSLLVWSGGDAVADVDGKGGVYVLGAIDSAERALVDAHLATWRDCRDELARLPALLARAHPREVSPIGTVEAGSAGERALAQLIGPVVNLAADRRRRTRWRYTAAAAAATAGGLFGGLRCLASPAASATVVAFSPGHGSWRLGPGAEPDHGGRLGADLRPRDSIRFSITAAAWPAVRQHLEELAARHDRS